MSSSENAISELAKQDYRKMTLICGFACPDPRAAIRRFQFYDAPVILSDVLCTASEEELIDCSLTGYGVFTNCTNISVAHCEG